jgi:hypothetical protein
MQKTDWKLAVAAKVRTKSTFRGHVRTSWNDPARTWWNDSRTEGEGRVWCGLTGLVHFCLQGGGRTRRKVIPLVRIGHRVEQSYCILHGDLPNRVHVHYREVKHCAHATLVLGLTCFMSFYGVSNTLNILGTSSVRFTLSFCLYARKLMRVEKYITHSKCYQERYKYIKKRG